jgi:hypothetical protein
MKRIAYLVCWSSMLLMLVLAGSTGTVKAQSEGRGDTPATPGSQARPTPGQAGMEEMRGGQESMGQMT